MCSRGVIVHCPSRLGTVVRLLGAELPRGDGVFTEWTLKRAKAVHHFDGVMSHNSSVASLFRHELELKLPSPLPVHTQNGDI
jgi:hypothetical protein